MNCWHCDRPSHAACFFCGRGVCKDHVRSMPGVLELFRDRGGTLRGLVVDAVMWCGICDPKRYPVNLDAVDPAPAEPLVPSAPADATSDMHAMVDPEATRTLRDDDRAPADAPLPRTEPVMPPRAATVADPDQPAVPAAPVAPSSNPPPAAPDDDPPPPTPTAPSPGAPPSSSPTGSA